MMPLRMLLLVIAFIAFAMSAFGVVAGRVNFVAFGLAFLTAAELVPR